MPQTISLRRLAPALLLATAVLAAAPGLVLKAAAADLDPGYAEVPPPITQQQLQFGSGWYIRGDLGVTRGLAVKAGDEPYDTSTFQSYAGGPSYPRGIFEGPGQTPPGITAAGSNNLKYTASLGAGYQLNNWFRADAIFDYHQPVSSAYQGQGRPCVTGTAGVGPVPYQAESLYSTTCTPTLAAKLNSYDVLVNGYIDLGTYYTVTPYVGAGVGLSFGNASASSKYIQGNDVPYNVTYTDAINGSSYNQYWDRSQSVRYYNLAFAFMGGIAIDVFAHTKLDIGYRYLNLGSVLGNKIATQEVHAGLRYMIDN